MQIHNIYCGLLSSAIPEEEAAALVRSLAIEYFPNGHTIHEATGRWNGGNGPIDEQTLIVEVWEVNGFLKPPYAEFAGEFKDRASQESVVILSVKSDALVI